MQPIRFLTGSKIFLRGLEKTDLSLSYIQWLNDEEVSKLNSHAIFPFTQLDADRFFDRVNNSSVVVPFAIILSQNKKHIGNASIQAIDWVHRSGELAILLGDKSSWRKGIGFEVVQLLAQYAFERLNLHRIYLGTFLGNTAMKKIAEKIGMKEEGISRQAIYKFGQYIDIIHYGMTEDEYEKKR